jgi:hypothetical protein
MPAYDYEITDSAGRKLGSITAILPVAERDDVSVCRRGSLVRLLRKADGTELGTARVRGRVHVRRAQLPDRLAIAGHAQNPEAPDWQMQRGFYREEQRLGADFEKHAKMTKREIREVMAMPDAPEAEE